MALRWVPLLLNAWICIAASSPDPLAARVTIYRDTYGVPHIIGETEEATFFGYGYAQAEDHLERMMLEYRDAQGRRAEVVGFGALGDGRILCNDDWAHLMVVEESEPKHVWSLLPYGESENPASPHYNDQARLHSQRRLKPFWFSPADILDHTESAWGDKDRLRQLLGTTQPFAVYWPKLKAPLCMTTIITRLT